MATGRRCSGLAWRMTDKCNGPGLFLCLSQLSNRSSGIGRASAKPCRASTPASSRHCRWASVSTPSATTTMPSSRPIRVAALTTARARRSSGNTWMKDLSSLSLVAGRSFRLDRLEKPVPKSSMASPTPASRTRRRLSWTTSASSIASDSVSSSSSSSGLMSAHSSAPCRAGRNSGEVSWARDTLMATLVGRPSSRRRAAKRAPCSRLHSPRRMIKPDFSATGMKRSGVRLRPNTLQRIRASTASTRPSRDTMGWYSRDSPPLSRAA